MMEENTRNIKKKNVIVGTVLGTLFGPLGYLYFGWRYAVLLLAVYLIFGTIQILAGLPTPLLSKLAFMLVAGMKAHAICSERNQWIEQKDERAQLFQYSPFPLAWLAISDLMVGMTGYYAASLCLHAAFMADSTLKTIMFTTLTPVTWWIVTFPLAWLMSWIDMFLVQRSFIEYVAHGGKTEKI